MTTLTGDGFDWAVHLAGADVAVTSGITRGTDRRGPHRVRRQPPLPSVELGRVPADRPPAAGPGGVLFASRRDLLGLLGEPDGDARGDVQPARAVIDRLGLQTVVLRANTYPQPETVEVTATVVTAGAVAQACAVQHTVVGDLWLLGPLVSYAADGRRVRR